MLKCSSKIVQDKQLILSKYQHLIIKTYFTKYIKSHIKIKRLHGNSNQPNIHYMPRIIFQTMELMSP